MSRLGRVVAALSASVLSASVLLTLLPAPAPAAASCAYSAEDPTLVERADVIFSGTIVRDRTPRLGDERRLTFAVSAVYKGDAFGRQLVISDATSSVALDVSGPGEFLVYGRLAVADPRHPTAGVLRSDACSGTRPGPAPASFGAGHAPLPGSDSQPRARWPLATVLAVVLGATGFLVRWRRRSARTKG